MNLETYVGKSYDGFEVEIDKSRIRAFSDAIGAEDPEIDGDRLIAPLTFGFTILMDAGQLFNVLTDMKIPHGQTVHGSQGFDYGAPIRSGDVISGRQTITSIYRKKGGALIFIEVANRLENQVGDYVCGLRSTIVVRNE